MHGPKRGVFITFEGVEGSGKSTQARLLADRLKEDRIACTLVRDPGGTDIGEALRGILLNREFKVMHRKCEVLLFIAARGQLVYEKVMPALVARKVVISDRFFDSTFAYQVSGRDLPARLVSIMNRFATAGIKPDLTFLVDCDVTRARMRGTFDDRMESENIKYHEDVRSAYLTIAKRAKKRVKVINGERTVDEISREITDIAREFLVRKGYRL